MARPQNILLVGFMASGKTEAGKALARLTGWPLVDTDAEIVAGAGRPIHQIFQEEGEPAFRDLETNVVQELCAGSGQIIAAGGGAFVGADNRARMLAGGLVFCLSALPETIHRRITNLPSLPPSQGEHQDESAVLPNQRGNQGWTEAQPVRPLLAGDDQLARIQELLAQRAQAYAQAHFTVETDDLAPEQVARRILELCGPELEPLEGELMVDPDLAAVVQHSGGEYPLVAGWGIIDNLGDRLADLGTKGPVYIITDSRVMNPYGRMVQRALQKAGIGAHCFIIPSGEPSKSFNVAQGVYDWLVGLRAERGQPIIAVGGGVAGDLAGFVAATYLRGVPFFQVPTSMAAMVDASIGGKVAVNLPQAKNMVGAFYQPLGVFADVQCLATLGKRELAEGWAEAIKHGFILDAGLVDAFEEHAEALMAVEPEISTELIRRSMAIKADVVSRDERETLGIRILLNYGHTIGHALESSTEYGSFLHGEAVSIGMMGAAHIAEHMGMISGEVVGRQQRLLERFNLPIGASGVAVDAVLGAMSLDKKTQGGSNRWVLLEEVGKAVVRSDVPRDLVEATVRDLVS